MKTTPRSSLHSATRAALFDELAKIGAADPNTPELKKQRIKKILKNALLAAGGAAAGSGVVTVGDEVFKKALGKTWENTPPNIKRWVVGPALGLATVGSAMAARKAHEEGEK